MATNPFIDVVEHPPPSKKYKLRLINTGQEIEVDPDCLPQKHDGQIGSILSILLENGIDVDHTCGGVVACSTCHVYIRKGGESCPEPIEEEEDQLDFAPAVDDDSRLACQCVPDGTMSVDVEIPLWNRNEVSEDH